MIYAGHVKNGVVVFDGGTPPDGVAVDVLLRASSPFSRDEAIAAKLQAAATLEQFFEIVRSNPEDGEDDEAFYQGMNANRSPGERLPYPPELQGKTR